MRFRGRVKVGVRLGLGLGLGLGSGLEAGAGARLVRGRGRRLALELCGRGGPRLQQGRLQGCAHLRFELSRLRGLGLGCGCGLYGTSRNMDEWLGVNDRD